MTREAFIVYVDLDPTPGPFHDKESALGNLRGILENQINHYNPVVAHAPDSMRPEEVDSLPNRHGRIEPRLFLFADRAEAQLVLDAMRDIIRRDITATVAEYLALTNAPAVTHHYSNHYWGWTNTGYFRLEILADNSCKLHLGTPTHFSKKGN